jgi:uncharacterized protein (DUF2267 family)
MEIAMSATGLEVFDKTIQTTNIWLDEIMEKIGPDRHVAWHVLRAVLHALRDRLPIELSAHLSAELPLLVRGAYYDQWKPGKEPLKLRTREEFLEYVARELKGTRPVNTVEAVQIVFQVLSRHMGAGQVAKAREALPEQVRGLWPAGARKGNVPSAA